MALKRSGHGPDQLAGHLGGGLAGENSGTSAHTPRRRGITLLWLIGFFCTLLLLTWFIGWSDATRKVDRLIHDSWVRLHQQTVPDDVVIAAIDTQSLGEVGRWPWPRAVQARFFEQLSNYKPKAVVIDLLYNEPARTPEDDARLAAAIVSLPVSILPVLTEGGAGQIASETLPLPVITRGVTDLGHIFLPIDDDGIVRRIYLKSGFNRAHWSALSLAALQAISNYIPALPGSSVDSPGRVGQWVQDHEVLIPFYGPNNTFKRVSASRILAGNAESEQLSGKIVFVGMTTTGLGDVVPTPVSALDQPMPGIEIHANIFAALRDGSLVRLVDKSVNVLVALVLLPLMLLLYSRAPPQWGLVGTLFGAALPVVMSFLLYRYERFWYAPLSASLPVLISYLFWSRHRLGYINRFLEQEQAKLAPIVPLLDSRSNDLLAEFFSTATQHLPIRGWRFSTDDETFQGGQGLPENPVTCNEIKWCVKQNVHVREYPTPDHLHIELAVTDQKHGREITDYVDTLPLVRSRVRGSRSMGPIEKLQANAEKLGEQMAWLRSANTFTETVLAGSPAGLVVWNAAGECVQTNDLVYMMVPGFFQHSVLLEFLNTIGRHPQKGEDARLLSSLILEGAAWQVPVSDGDRELIVNFRTVGNSLAERLVCATILDVSDIRTAERARAEMVDYLSHDLRSPLISALYLLEDDVDQRIEQNIKQSLSMMDDLLHIARADSLSEARFDAVLVNAVLDNTLDQLLPQARSRDIRFVVDTVDDDLWVQGDAASLERAVTNIVANAIKYSPPGTAVSIRLYMEQPHAVIQVDDQGVGIDPEILDQLFTRFKRDGKTASRFKGIGLGLALVSRVVQLHGGAVEASNTDQGARITLRLPLESSETIG